MAEGVTEEESSEMLAPTAAPLHHQPYAVDHIKHEDDDQENCIGYPEQPMGIQQQQQEARASSCMSVAGQTTNESMASLVGYQNLQNLASLQQSLPEATCLVNGTERVNEATSSPASIAPLNLSVNSSTSISKIETPSDCGSETNLSTSLNSSSDACSQSSSVNLPPHLPSQPAPLPQFVLASGHLVQGIQGAQLLTPTSQGLSTQMILIIPINHVNTSGQMVNLALSNGQVITTSVANLQSIAQTNLANHTNTPIIPPTATSAMGPTLLNPALSHLFPGDHQPSLPHHLNASPLIPPVTPNLLPMSSALLTAASNPQQPPPNNLMSRNNHYQETKPPITRSSSPPLNNNLVVTSNGDSPMHLHRSNSSQSLKRSPSSLSSSPNCNDSSTADLLVDSPNQPTINQTSSNVVDGINLDEIKEFAKAFKLRRLSLGLTQTQVGQALSVTEGPAYSQSAICSALASQMFAVAQLSSHQQAMFEKLDITPKSAQKIKPVLERWMKEAEERYKSGQNHLTDFIGVEPSKKRKRRTSFTPQALELLNAHFERNTHPSGTEITGLAHQLGYEREVIRIWFCNKRQALKNTVRMMSKSIV